jgi:hypothetical protein
MVNVRLLCPFACVLGSLLPGPALAWSDVGHRIICEIAFQELELTARDRVKEMIAQDPEFDTFANACTWPDHPRQRPSEHYVNLPRDADGLEEDPCPLATDCVVPAIEKDLAVLSSSSATEQERLEALEYLGHLGPRRPPAAAPGPGQARGRSASIDPTSRSTPCAPLPA